MDGDEVLIETAKVIYLKTGNPGFILLRIYDILLERGEIDPIEDQPQELLDAVDKRMNTEAAKGGTKEIKDLWSLKNSPAYEKELIIQCKKQVVGNYFTLLNEIDNF